MILVEMIPLEEASLLWKAHETAPWLSLQGNHTLVGIVRSFDPNGFLKLEVARADIDALVYEEDASDS